MARVGSRGVRRCKRRQVQAQTLYSCRSKGGNASSQKGAAGVKKKQFLLGNEGGRTQKGGSFMLFVKEDLRRRGGLLEPSKRVFLLREKRAAFSRSTYFKARRKMRQGGGRNA